MSRHLPRMFFLLPYFLQFHFSPVNESHSMQSFKCTQHVASRWKLIVHPGPAMTMDTSFTTEFSQVACANSLDSIVFYFILLAVGNFSGQLDCLNKMPRELVRHAFWYVCESISSQFYLKRKDCLECGPYSSHRYQSCLLSHDGQDTRKQSVQKCIFSLRFLSVR